MATGAEQLRVGVIMGSDSDMSTMREVGIALRLAGLEPLVDYEFRVVSAHRTPEHMARYAKEAEERGLQVIIAGAGGSAHLPGMVASETILPVAGVAVTSNPTIMNRALGSLIGMPEGKPLATFQDKVGAYNAGLFASRVLASSADAQRIAIVARSEQHSETMRHVGRALGALGLQEEVDYVNTPLLGSPEKLNTWAKDNAIGVFVAAATGVRQLPDIIATATEVPVLGVAVTMAPDVMGESLYYLMNQEQGSPVGAFQGPAGAFNTGLKAARILALNNPGLRQRINDYNENLKVPNFAKDNIMSRLGDVEYDALEKEDLRQLIEEATAVLNGELS